MRTFNWQHVVFAATVFALAVAGSTSQARGARSTPERLSAAPVTLRFATWDTGNLLQYEKQVAALFEKSHPSIHIQVEAYGSGFDEKMAAAFGAGDPPDVEYMWNFPAYAPSLLPLNKLIAKDRVGRAMLHSFYPAILDYNRYKGNLYALPIGFTTQVIYYNKNLFRTAHLRDPRNGWTWNDFIKDAKKVSQPVKKQFGCVLPSQPDPYDWEALIWSNGGSWVSPNGKKIQGYMNSARNAHVLDMLGSLVRSKACTLAGGNNQLQPSDLFAAGKIGMELDGDWPLAQYRSSKVNFGTVGLPKFPGKPVRDVIDQSGISISKATKHLDASWQFVKFFASARSEAVRQGDLPVMPSVAKRRGLLHEPVYRAFYQMVSHSGNTPASSLIANWSKVDANIQNAISSVLLGQASGRRALDDAVSTSQRYMQNP